MPEITYSVTISAPPNKVFKALTEQKQVAAWWTADCNIDNRIGGYASFEFKAADGSRDGYTYIRIDKLVPDSVLEWYCLDQNYLGQTDWVGTNIRFNLADNGQGGTTLNFAHTEWKDKGGCYDLCVEGWAFVLKTSLKEFVETGKGQPYALHKERMANAAK